jgi:hypothetical protein
MPTNFHVPNFRSRQDQTSDPQPEHFGDEGERQWIAQISHREKEEEEAKADPGIIFGFTKDYFQFMKWVCVGLLIFVLAGTALALLVNIVFY